MSVRCHRCAFEAPSLPDLAAHARETHAASRPHRPGHPTGTSRPGASLAVPTPGELRSVMAHGREGSVARNTGAGFEDTGERQACESCGNLDVLKPVARSTWSLDPEHRTALVCSHCAGADTVAPSV